MTCSAVLTLASMGLVPITLCPRCYQPQLGLARQLRRPCLKRAMPVAYELRIADPAPIHAGAQRPSLNQLPAYASNPRDLPRRVALRQQQQRRSLGLRLASRSRHLLPFTTNPFEVNQQCLPIRTSATPHLQADLRGALSATRKTRHNLARPRVRALFLPQGAQRPRTSVASQRASVVHQ